MVEAGGIGKGGGATAAEEVDGANQREDKTSEGQIWLLINIFDQL
jgi:hypothetical protein